MSKIYIYLFAALITMVSCTESPSMDEEGLPRTDAIRFNIGTPSYEIVQGPASRTTSADAPIAHLWYTILDGNGNIIKPQYHILSKDLSTLMVEGLADGNYSILFLATTDDDDSPVTPALSDIAQQWLVNPQTDKPLDLDYLYKRIYFTVGIGNDSRTIAVELERSVARVELNLIAAREYTTRYIRKIEFSLDDGSSVYQYLNGDGTMGGTARISDIDMTDKRWFYTLPSSGAVSGSVKLTCVRSDSSTYTSSYKFTESEFQANKVSTININWSHPEDSRGFINMRVSDYNATNFKMMLRDDEPREVFYSRTFRSDLPLQISIGADKKLQVRFFSAIGIADVKVLCRFNRHSSEFFEILHMDSVRAFQESAFDLPIVSQNCTFTTEDGRQVIIPMYPNLKSSNVTFVTVTDDPYMQKIATITSHWNIGFSPFHSADNNSSWKHMEPMHCREAMVLATNMPFMFSQPEFEEELLEYEGRLKDDNQNVISLDVIRNKLVTFPGFEMGRVRYVYGLGGVGVYGLTHENYKSHYWDFDPGNPFRPTAYHEFGHCIGYAHESNMTDGGVWTKLCSDVMYNLGKAGKLPVNSYKVLNTGERTIE